MYYYSESEMAIWYVYLYHISYKLEDNFSFESGQGKVTQIYLVEYRLRSTYLRHHSPSC